ncbi:hypothetical protein [Pedobacter frigoris]|uniref:hypothetical protein n=1 Tax=Pedobacter frigoris TaxID=2571272 RepID=UPI0029319385|nr:hypothetical protein [Pedobacter frigoris]
MGHKKVCFECRKAYSINGLMFSEIEHSCPECDCKAVVLNHKFRPPKREDTKQWDLAKFLVDHGFYFDHVNCNGSYVRYPTTMEDAKTFVVKYKKQAYLPSKD